MQSNLICEMECPSQTRHVFSSRGRRKLRVEEDREAAESTGRSIASAWLQCGTEKIAGPLRSAGHPTQSVADLEASSLHVVVHISNVATGSCVRGTGLPSSTSLYDKRHSSASTCERAIINPSACSWSASCNLIQSRSEILWASPGSWLRRRGSVGVAERLRLRERAPRRGARWIGVGAFEMSCVCEKSCMRNLRRRGQMAKLGNGETPA